MFRYLCLRLENEPVKTKTPQTCTQPGAKKLNMRGHASAAHHLVAVQYDRRTAVALTLTCL